MASSSTTSSHVPRQLASYKHNKPLASLLSSCLNTPYSILNLLNTSEATNKITNQTKKHIHVIIVVVNSNLESVSDRRSNHLRIHCTPVVSATRNEGQQHVCRRCLRRHHFECVLVCHQSLPQSDSPVSYTHLTLPTIYSV